MELSSHRSNVARALKGLDQAIENLVNALAHSDAVCFLEQPSDLPLRAVCEAYSTMTYGVSDDTHSSPVCLGVVGVSANIVAYARTVNAVKAEFKSICTQLSRIRIRIPVKNEKSPTRAIPAIRVILRNIRRSDLNLLAAYRKIPIIPAPPVSIAFTRANTRSVYRKSVDELYTVLLTSEHPQAGADRARLDAMTPKETHLALVTERYANVRANIVLGRLDARGRGRLQMVAELPILYTKGRHPYPSIRFPQLMSDASPLRRPRDPKLEAQPFLESLPVYRYRKLSKHAK